MKKSTDSPDQHVFFLFYFSNAHPRWSFQQDWQQGYYLSRFVFKYSVQKFNLFGFQQIENSKVKLIQYLIEEKKSGFIIAGEKFSHLEPF